MTQFEFEKMEADRATGNPSYQNRKVKNETIYIIPDEGLNQDEVQEILDNQKQG